MAFRLESDLREPVAKWLHAGGFDICEEVPILTRRADLVGFRMDGVTAIEMKLCKWEEALRQAIAYQLAADWAWVAMPLPTAAKAYRERWRFEAERVGLLAVDERGRVRAPIGAQPSPRLLPFVQERVLRWCRSVGDTGRGADHSEPLIETASKAWLSEYAGERGANVDEQVDHPP